MPTYEYKCEDCGYQFEYFQSMTDDPLKVCPECKGKVKRLISAGAGIIFKGNGFYQTDYKSSCPKSSDTSGKADNKTPCGGSSCCPHNK